MIVDKLEVSIKGLTPMIMHSGRTANPLDPMTKKLKEMSSKRGKTDEDIEKLLAIQWQAALYWNDQIGLYIPSLNLSAAFLKAAKKVKAGSKTAAISFPQMPGPELITKNHKDFEKLKSDPENKLTMPVTINRQKVIACRAIFNQWSMNFILEFERELFDTNEVKNILNIWSQRVGIGSWAPGSPKPGPHGKFVITSIIHIDGKTGSKKEYNFDKE